MNCNYKIFSKTIQSEKYIFVFLSNQHNDIKGV